VYGASGTVRTLTRLARENGAGGGAACHTIRGAVDRAQFEQLGARVLEHARGGRPLAGLGRLLLRDVAAALAILIALMEELDIGSLLETDAGLRCGLMHDLHRQRQHWRPSFHFASDCCRGVLARYPSDTAPNRLYCLVCLRME
jgi:exopolyphosphatase/pppGpp-phosphohydrolase